MAVNQDSIIHQISGTFNISHLEEHSKNIIVDHNRMLSSKMMHNQIRQQNVS